MIITATAACALACCPTAHKPNFFNYKAATLASSVALDALLVATLWQTETVREGVSEYMKDTLPKVLTSLRENLNSFHDFLAEKGFAPPRNLEAACTKAWYNAWGRLCG